VIALRKSTKIAKMGSRPAKSTLTYLQLLTKNVYYEDTESLLLSPTIDQILRGIST